MYKYMSAKEVSSDIYKQVADEIYKPKFKHYPTRKVIANRPNSIWSIDLVDIPDLKEENNNIRYMLNIVDVFSRYAWSLPIQNKQSITVLNGLKEIIKENDNTKPNYLWSDEGTEFKKEFNEYCKENNIIQYHTYGNAKSSIVERYNRTIKTNLYKLFMVNRSNNWVDILPDVVKKYNNTKHRVIGMTPSDAMNLNKDQIKELYKKQYGNQKKPKGAPKFKIGDYVRISRIKDTFEKGYHPNWSMEIYKIVNMKPTTPYTYELEDLNAEPINGSFYEQELQKTEQDPTKEFLVEKVLKTRTYRGKKQQFVKFLGYNDSYNEWINA